MLVTLRSFVWISIEEDPHTSDHVESTVSSPISINKERMQGR